ncbi:MAG: serine protease, partial [Planctomycetota bacterium]|nr:serine protease [Planctomycetota bacterium]
GRRRGTPPASRPPNADLARTLARHPGLVLAMLVGVVAIVALVIHRSQPSEPLPEFIAAPPEVATSVVPDEEAQAAPAAAPRDLSTQEVVARASPSVAIVLGRNGSGTAFLVADGILATNRHVIEDELLREVKVQFPDAAKHLRGNYGVTLLYEDPELDLAFLALSIDLPPLPMAERHEFSRGEEITVIGSPGMGNGQILRNAISRGLLSTEAEIDGKTYYQLDIAINPGNSGGPVFDRRGDVVGVVTLKAYDKDGLGFCLPLRSLRASLARCRATSPADRATMGALHRFRVLAAALWRSAGAYVFAGEIYVLAMESAIEEGRDLNEGLQSARVLLMEHIRGFDGAELSTMRDESKRVLADDAVPPASRGRLDRLVESYHAIKEHVERPTGTLDSFKARLEGLSAARDQLGGDLLRLDGVPLYEDDE